MVGGAWLRNKTSGLSGPKICLFQLNSRMGYMIAKERALEILKENISNKNLQKHHYGVAAAMKGLALELGGDP